MSTLNAITSGAGGVALSGDTSGNLVIQSAGANSAVFNSFGIGLGNTAPTSGLGITFPATQSASTNANTLDDYEEGTWTPTATPSSGSFTTVTTSGRYVKTGNQVTVNFRIAITSIGTAANQIYVTNFPFAAYDGNVLSGATREDAVSGYGLVMSPNGTTSAFISRYDGGASISAGYSMSFCVSYITA